MMSNVPVETVGEFDDAYKACLGTCFQVLTVNLLPSGEGEAEAIAKFNRCCELCKKAKAIAEGKS